VPIRSWITEDVARTLCAQSGHDLAGLKKAALSRDFRPMDMGITAGFEADQVVRPFKSRNVVAALPGTNPDLANQWIVYTAHWDHLGKQTDESGTRIFRGAVDNASGVAALLSIAQAFTQAKPGPERSILFMAPTAEEAGLLGARYYAEHPFHPLTNTLADINIDGVSAYGKAADLEDLSNFNSTLDDMLQEAAARQGRTLKPSSRLETGLFYRADHFEFAKAGVPVLYAKGGIDLIGKPAGRGDELETEYITNRYHKPEDQILPEWDLSGAAQDMQLLFEVGWAVANGDQFPEWKPASEFRARRDEMLARG
jgi:Zn-dependent M28 family amino/carboxypeptidase